MGESVQIAAESAKYASWESYTRCGSCRWSSSRGSLMPRRTLPDGWGGAHTGLSFSTAEPPTQSQLGDYSEWPGRDVLDSGGERLGGVREIYLDRETGRPGMGARRRRGDSRPGSSPFADAEVESSTIRVALSATGSASAGHRRRTTDRPVRGARLYAHYGIGYDRRLGSGRPKPRRRRGWGTATTPDRPPRRRRVARRDTTAETTPAPSDAGATSGAAAERGLCGHRGRRDRRGASVAGAQRRAATGRAARRPTPSPRRPVRAARVPPNRPDREAAPSTPKRPSAEEPWPTDATPAAPSRPPSHGRADRRSGGRARPPAGGDRADGWGPVVDRTRVDVRAARSRDPAPDCCSADAGRRPSSCPPAIRSPPTPARRRRHATDATPSAFDPPAPQQASDAGARSETFDPAHDRRAGERRSRPRRPRGRTRAGSRTPSPPTPPGAAAAGHAALEPRRPQRRPPRPKPARSGGDKARPGDIAAAVTVAGGAVLRHPSVALTQPLIHRPHNGGHGAHLPSDAVIVVAGVPGAGKTTLLRRASIGRRDASWTPTTGRAAARSSIPATTRGSPRRSPATGPS